MSDSDSDDRTPLDNLSDAIQAFVNRKAEIGHGSPGLVTDWFIAIGYTRIDEDGDQPYSRTYAAGPNPYGAVGIAQLCLADMESDLGAGDDRGNSEDDE